MVLSAIWTLAFGAHSSPPDIHHTDTGHDDDDPDQAHPTLQENETNIARILERQRLLAEAERDILGTTVYLPAPSIRDDSAESKTSLFLVVTSLTLNNVGCYPFFGIRDRHQVFPKLFPLTSPRSSFEYLQQVYRSQGVLGMWYGMPCSMICHVSTIFYEALLNSIVGRFRQRSRKNQQRQQLNQEQQAVADGYMTAVTATDISATIMAAMPTVSSSSPSSTTFAVNQARKGLQYFSSTTPRSPTLLQEFYPEMVCAMTSSMITRVLLYPLDTVASRVTAQGAIFPGIGAAPTPYSGFWDCWIKSIRPEGGGLLGLYSGVLDCIIVEAMVRWLVLEGTWFAHMVIKWIHQRQKLSF
ncbi:hypothetical protein EC968_006928 [Mortierella alpina]|nr:hypothetical protein EC968_006928 [Mortierella alpina]